MLSQSNISLLNRLINKGDKIVYLVGAGISMEPPSSLPSANQFSRILLNFSIPKEEVDTILSIPGIRYEMIVERIKKNYDKNLDFLNYLELITSPNIIHHFLGWEIINKHPVITTNFDFLIEHALKVILPEAEHSNIIPIITQNDFLNNQDYLKLYDEGKFPLYKIHGSKKNLISGEDTTNFLITTLSSLGMNKEDSDTFTIEQHKKGAINDLLNNGTLLVMGYSGSDAFDVGPLLQNFPSLHKLIWIDHTFEEETSILEIQPNEDISLKNLSTCDQLLYNIRNSNDFQVIKIRINTNKFVSTFLSNTLLATDQTIKLNKNKEYDRVDFKTWVEPIFAEVKETKKLYVATKIYFDLERLENVIKCAQKGLNLAENEGDQNLKAQFLSYLGLCLYKKGNYNDALEKFEAAAKIDEEINNQFELGEDLYQIGDVHRRKGEFQEALKFYDKSKTIFEEINNFRGLATVLSRLALNHEELDELDEALDCLKAAIKLDNIIGNLSGKAERLNNIGEIYHMKLGDYENGLIFFQEALKIHEELGKLSSIAVNYNNIATIYADKEDFSIAYEMYDKALKIFNDQGDLDGISTIQSNLAINKMKEGNLSEAIDLMKSVIEINDKLGNFRNKSENLIELGKFYVKSEDFSAAVPLFQEAHNISLAKNYTMTNSLYNLAEAYILMERFNDAIQTYEKAIKLADKNNNMGDKFIYLNNLAFFYEDLEDYKTALEFYREALNTNRNLSDDVNNKILIFRNMARTLKKLGESDEAMEYYTRAFNIAQEIEDKNEVADVLIEIGTILTEQSKFSEAIDKFSDALFIYKETKNWNDMLLVLGSLGYCSVALGDYENAKIFCGKSLSIAEKLNIEDTIQTQRENLAFINQKLDEGKL